MQHTQPGVVLITGAARRIGASIATHLHAHGFNVVIHHNRSSQAADQLVEQLNNQRADSAVRLQADLLNSDALEPLINESAAVWGRLDALINNASTFYPTLAGSITEDHWADLIGTNLKAPLFLAQAAIPHLRRQHGSIVNIVDIHAQRPMRKHTVYSIAKAGLAALTRSLARDLAPEIRVNAIAPGAILWPEEEMDGATKQAILERVALQRPGEPTDIASAVKYLLQDAHYVTGQIIAIDGGRSLYM